MRNSYTEAEKNYIRKNYAEKTDAEMADFIGRSVNSVMRCRLKMGLKHKRLWRGAETQRDENRKVYTEELTAEQKARAARIANKIAMNVGAPLNELREIVQRWRSQYEI